MRRLFFWNFLETTRIRSGDNTDNRDDEGTSEYPEEEYLFRRFEVFCYERIGCDVPDFFTEKKVPKNKDNWYKEK